MHILQHIRLYLLIVPIFGLISCSQKEYVDDDFKAPEITIASQIQGTEAFVETKSDITTHDLIIVGDLKEHSSSLLPSPLVQVDVSSFCKSQNQETFSEMTFSGNKNEFQLLSLIPLKAFSANDSARAFAPNNNLNCKFMFTFTNDIGSTRRKSINVENLKISIENQPSILLSDERGNELSISEIYNDSIAFGKKFLRGHQLGARLFISCKFVSSKILLASEPLTSLKAIAETLDLRKIENLPPAYAEKQSCRVFGRNPGGDLIMSNEFQLYSKPLNVDVKYYQEIAELNSNHAVLDQADFVDARIQNLSDYSVTYRQNLDHGQFYISAIANIPDFPYPTLEAKGDTALIKFTPIVRSDTWSVKVDGDSILTWQDARYRYFTLPPHSNARIVLSGRIGYQCRAGQNIVGYDFAFSNQNLIMLEKASFAITPQFTDYFESAGFEALKYENTLEATGTSRGGWFVPASGVAIGNNHKLGAYFDMSSATCVPY